jgi:hypothetical protein
MTTKKVDPVEQAMLKRELLAESHIGVLVERKLYDENGNEFFVLDYTPVQTPTEAYQRTLAEVATGIVAASPVKLKVEIDIEPA